MENKHLFFAEASKFIKYRGDSNQIDYKDTIISMLSNLPGISSDAIFSMIYSDEMFAKYPELKAPLRAEVNSAFELMVKDEIIIVNEDQYFLWDDAWSHDVAKTNLVSDKLKALGLSSEKINFLSSAVVMASEVAKNENFDLMKTEATSPAVQSSTIKEVKELSSNVEEPTIELNFQTLETKEIVLDNKASTLEISNVMDKIKPVVFDNTTDNVPNPFDGLSSNDIARVHINGLNIIIDEEKKIEEAKQAIAENEASIISEAENNDYHNEAVSIRDEENSNLPSIEELESYDKLESKHITSNIEVVKNEFGQPWLFAAPAGVLAEPVKSVDLLGRTMKLINEKDAEFKVEAKVLKLTDKGILFMITSTNSTLYTLNEVVEIHHGHFKTILI